MVFISLLVRYHDELCVPSYRKPQNLHTKFKQSMTLTFHSQVVIHNITQKKHVELIKLTF